MEHRKRAFALGVWVSPRKAPALFAKQCLSAADDTGRFSNLKSWGRGIREQEEKQVSFADIRKSTMSSWVCPAFLSLCEHQSNLIKLTLRLQEPCYLVSNPSYHRVSQSRGKGSLMRATGVSEDWPRHGILTLSS